MAEPSILISNVKWRHPLLSSAHISAPPLDSVRSFSAGWHLLAELRVPAHRRNQRHRRRALATSPAAAMKHIASRDGFLNSTDTFQPADEQAHLEPLIGFAFAIVSHQAADATWDGPGSVSRLGCWLRRLRNGFAVGTSLFVPQPSLEAGENGELMIADRWWGLVGNFCITIADVDERVRQLLPRWSRQVSRQDFGLLETSQSGLHTVSRKRRYLSTDGASAMPPGEYKPAGTREILCRDGGCAWVTGGGREEG